MLVVKGNRNNTMGTTMPATAAIRAVRNERGIALVLALVMLVLLGLLGAFALSTSSSDLFIAGNFRNAQDALYSGDGGLEWAEINPAIYDAIVPQTKNIWPNGADQGNPTTWWPVTVGPTTVETMVEWIRFGPLPENLATDQNIGVSGQGSSFQAAYYIVRANGAGRANTNAQIALESEVLKIVPK
jgi:hypothetical protein